MTPSTTHSGRSAPAARGGGFTLIELLVVIGILALLAALLLPVVASARRKAHQSWCVSNEHQIDLAMDQYVSDWDYVYPSWDVHFPDPSFWTKAIAPYLKTSRLNLACPDIVYRAVDPDNGRTDAIPGYAYNFFLENGHSVSVSAVPRPAITVLICDEAYGIPETIGPQSWFFNGFPPRPQAEMDALTRHQGGGDFLLMDGHVKWYTPRSIDCGNDSCPRFEIH